MRRPKKYRLLYAKMLAFERTFFHDIDKDALFAEAS